MNTITGKKRRVDLNSEERPTKKIRSSRIVSEANSQAAVLLQSTAAKGTHTQTTELDKLRRSGISAREHRDKSALFSAKRKAGTSKSPFPVQKMAEPKLDEPYDPYGGVVLQRGYYVLQDSYAKPWLDKARTDPQITTGGYDVNEYCARAIFDSTAGLGCFIGETTPEKEPPAKNGRESSVASGTNEPAFNPGPNSDNTFKHSADLEEWEELGEQAISCIPESDRTAEPAGKNDLGVPAVEAAFETKATDTNGFDDEFDAELTVALEETSAASIQSQDENAVSNVVELDPTSAEDPGLEPLRPRSKSYLSTTLNLLSNYIKDSCLTCSP